MDRTYIIAEAGVNHNGDIGIAKSLIQSAADCGADAIKFQTFKTEGLVTTEAKQAKYQTENTGIKETQYQMLKRLELSYDSHFELQETCLANGIDFISSPFDIESADFLIKNLGLNTIKLGSGELTNAPLLWHVSQKYAVNIILSTGMANVAEIKEALAVLSMGYNNKMPGSRADILGAYDYNILKDKVKILHCTSDYPASFNDVNLRAMDTIAKTFELPVGYSDHTLGPQIALAAVARGACVIEKHFTLATAMEGPDHKASMTPDDFKKMVNAIRNIEEALGDGKKVPRPSELATKSVARKTIVASRKIKRGERLTEENITTKRPEKGLSPFNYWDMIGKKAYQDYQPDDAIKS